jgi:nucleotide-binding universal stress UspA family protein
MAPPSRHILIPVGSDATFDATIRYLDRLYTDKQSLETTLLHVYSRLPPEFAEDADFDPATRRRMALWQETVLAEASYMLSRARAQLAETGVNPNKIHRLEMGREIGTVRDICRWAACNPVDAVLVARRGRSDLDAYFMGGITARLADNCTHRPLWIANGEVRAKRVLVFYDCEPNGRRAAEHVQRMLGTTAVGITLLHITHSLRRFVPREFTDRFSESEVAWNSRNPGYIEPKLAATRKMLLASGFKGAQVDTRIVEGSASTAEDITVLTRRGDYGTVVLCRHGVPSIREFLQGVDSAAGRDLQNGLAVWIV